MKNKIPSDHGQSNVRVVDFGRGAAATTAKPPAKGKWYRKLGWVATAALLAIVPIASLVETPIIYTTRSNTATIETATYESRTVRLPDGTLVVLHGDSKLRLEYSKGRRLVHQLAGDATYDVAKDPARPFVVSTSAIDATALGTRFRVTIGAKIRVAVEEGVVGITDRGATPDESWMTLKLTKGEHHDATPGAPVRDR